jgi:hypothetical protein
VAASRRRGAAAAAAANASRERTKAGSDAVRNTERMAKSCGCSPLQMVAAAEAGLAAGLQKRWWMSAW